MKKRFFDISDFDENYEEGDDDENDSYQGEVSKKFETKTAAVIYLIDARKKMFSPAFDIDKLPVICALEGIRTALRMKIFRLEKWLCSIILLGTKRTENPLTLNNLTVVRELELLGADHILKIDELIKAIEDQTYKSEYGYDKFSFGDALWLSSHIFNQKSKNLNKTIVLFTNDGNCTSDDPNDENRAIANAQDLYKSFVSFDIVPLGEDFDKNKFYKKIIQGSKNDACCVIPDPVSNVQEVVDRITKTDFNHVNLVKIPFVICDDFQIGVSIHFLVRKSKIPFKIKLSKATNERVLTKIQYFEEDTGSVVKADDLIKSQVVAQKNINFRPSELKAIQEIGKKELRLLGFKPNSVLRLEYFVKPCAFIYPDNTEYNGSSVFFTALLKRCIAKQVVPICTFSPRTTSSCRFVALIPQDENSHNEKNQELPPGFIVFFLPFAEEVRTVEDNTTERANPEQVELAAKYIKKLRFKYKVNCFHNPKIKYHWAAIEALALDLKEPEEVGDCTIPNYTEMSKRGGQIARDFIDSVYEKDYQPEHFAPARKSKPNFVKPKKEGSEKDVEEFMRQGRGEQLSNDALKNYLKSVGVTKGLSKIKKSDLLEKVRDHLKLK